MSAGLCEGTVYKDIDGHDVLGYWVYEGLATDEDVSRLRIIRGVRAY